MQVGVFLLMGLGILGIYEGARLTKVALLFDDPLGPGGFLILVSGMLFVCAAIYLVVHGRRRGTIGRKHFSTHIRPSSRVLIVFVLYAIMVPFIGYAISNVFFFVLAVHIFGERSWIRNVVIGLAFTVGFYLVFSYLAEVPLP